VTFILTMLIGPEAIFPRNAWDQLKNPKGELPPPPPGVYSLSVFSYVHLPAHAASAWLRTGDPTDPAWLRHHKARARGRSRSGECPHGPPAQSLHDLESKPEAKYFSYRLSFEAYGL